MGSFGEKYYFLFVHFCMYFVPEILVTRVLPFEDREESYHWKRLFMAWLHVFRTVPATQVFYIQFFIDWRAHKVVGGRIYFQW